MCVNSRVKICFFPFAVHASLVEDIYIVSLLNIIYSACCVESWVFSFAFWLGYSTLVSVNIVFYSVSYLNVFTVLHWLNIVYSACCVEYWVFSFAFWLGYSNSASILGHIEKESDRREGKGRPCWLGDSIYSIPCHTIVI